MVQKAVLSPSVAAFILACGFSIPSLVAGQFGGGGYTPPAPICPSFSCPSGQHAVGKPETKVVSYGCKDSGMSVLNMASLDPNNPMGGMNQGGKNLNKCCLERDICKQTCGMSSKECFDIFQKCQAKICKGDQNCQLQGMISEMSGDPFDTKKDDLSEKYDPEAAKCRGYNAAQASVCQCLPKAEVKDAQEKKLQRFYKKFNPEKLDDKGEIKDVQEVWKKWAGKEKDMFLALSTKYREKVVTMKQKPKPPPYKPPTKKSKDDDEEESAEQSFGAEEEKAAPPAEIDIEGEEFEKELLGLEIKKGKAKKDEDYDLAGELKDQVISLRAAEVKRLTAKKAKALEDEDYIAAKVIKGRLAKLEL
ncbi:unnamed protein product [Polarella glacialis]|uniref:UVR domain-containing protein n=1 Tax=Polarella glacialis TaxID=89957 RepID=A0A813LMX8_POLGL|nr:unnamed protein product [Polarella glacialis]